ncbi:MAG: 16S rRNA (cytosine(1402)-N(4))-methyltransferase RsmH [Candidatus Babeliales bacterium]|jgi:16S rRNA (cytosine1402-N4)-methyltransferase
MDNPQDNMPDQKPEQVSGHIPVLMEEVLLYLDPKPGEVYVDATLGGGGHTRAILTKEPTCKVIGLDWDKTVIETTGQELAQEFPGRFFPVWGNFSKVHKLVASAGFSKVHGILADFGTSQIQIKTKPGFSIYNDTFLDMRFSSSLFKVTAYQVVNYTDEKALADIFFDFAQETNSRKIARYIVERRKQKHFKTTGELAQFIKDLTPGNYHKIHPATKVFQALRIFINKELESIQSFLQNSTLVLADGARLVCISFHSLEDRMVKQFFKDHGSKSAVTRYFDLATKGACMATEEEIARNRSSRSARLRAGILRI